MNTFKQNPSSKGSQKTEKILSIQVGSGAGSGMGDKKSFDERLGSARQKTKDECYEVWQYLGKMGKTKLTAKQIFAGLNPLFTLGILKSRLRKLVEVRLVESFGKKTMYLREDITGNHYHGSTEIKDIMGKSTKNLVVDATNREEIKNILIQSIEKIKADYTSIERIDYKRNIEDIMMVIEEILGKKFINFYGLVIAEIVSQELFQKENGYNKLHRESKAKKYSIIK